jgi:hypothetical protein
MHTKNVIYHVAYTHIFAPGHRNTSTCPQYPVHTSPYLPTHLPHITHASTTPKTVLTSHAHQKRHLSRCLHSHPRSRTPQHVNLPPIPCTQVSLPPHTPPAHPLRVLNLYGPSNTSNEQRTGLPEAAVSSRSAGVLFPSNS